MPSLREAQRKAESMERKRDYAIAEQKRLENHIAQLESTLAAAAGAMKVPEEIVEAAKRLQSWTESYDMRFLAKHPYADIKARARGVLIVCNFILQLAGKDGGNGN